MAGTWELGKRERFSLGRTPSGEIDGYVIDATDEADARLTALAGTGAVYNNMLRQRVDCDQITDGEWQGDWYVNVFYGLNEIPKEGVVRFSASSKGGREKITQGLVVFDEIGIDPSHPAPDTGLSIGVDGDGNINGVEIPAPKPTFSLEIHTNYATLDNTYWAMLEDATGMVNKSAFYGRPKHTVRFLGFDFDGEIRLDDKADQVGRLRFDFEREKSYIHTTGNPNTGITVPGLERPVSKRGMDYFEVTYGEFKDSAANRIVSRPVSARAIQVSHEFNFANFGIGTG